MRPPIHRSEGLQRSGCALRSDTPRVASGRRDRSAQQSTGLSRAGTVADGDSAVPLSQEVLLGLTLDPAAAGANLPLLRQFLPRFMMP
jgi:hypothetical protein